MKYQFVRLLPLVFAVWGVAPTFAGIFDSPLSDNDAKQIRKLAVVSTLGDGFRGQTEGLTVFQNKSFVANAAGWGLDKAIATQLSDSIVAYGKIVGEVAPLPVPASAKKAIIAAARDQGFDSVLALQPQEDPHDRLIGPGPTLVHRKAPGFSAHTDPCNGMSVYMYRTADEKQIAHVIAYSCPNRFHALPWHDTWEEYSDVEKQTTLEAIQAFVSEQGETALAALHLAVHP